MMDLYGRLFTSMRMKKWKRLILRHNNIAFLTITEVIPLHEKH